MFCKITKCDSYFIAKCYRSLLQNASGFLSQNATIITKCDFYYKMRLLLQIATFITKCDFYYKLRQFAYFLIHLNSPINVV